MHFFGIDFDSILIYLIGITHWESIPNFVKINQLFMFYFRCTVDPVLFENFLTEDGDLLRAKFQAFKFPETNFVLFKGIVNVCLDKCRGVSKPFYDHFKIATNFKYRNASSSFSNIFCCFFVNLCRRFRYGKRYLIFMALEKM